ncbi:hypothetical protein [Arthrobacter mobilis]|uniref:Uncharacterized protein n=1 Tax=Arthrobacter mobilis TaxID=2724944 RepID=A0A7X6K5Z7_9MICC|nr:hypothetical protein [Arthrobacter mobilis]NKX54485.1 hypothetical protein [Arthrobacter mobilis]
MNRWQQLGPLQQDVLIGAGLGAALSLATWSWLWLAIGAWLGLCAGWTHDLARKRRVRREHARKTGAPVTWQERRAAEAGQREFRLRSASHYHVRDHAVQRRARNIAEAQGMDVLNAVFFLHYANRRFARPHRDDGLGPVNLHEVLGDLWSAEQIGEAICRSNVLIEDGWSYAWEPDKADRHLDELAAAHPGFSRRHLGRALDWGYELNR